MIINSIISADYREDKSADLETVNAKCPTMMLVQF